MIDETKRALPVLGQTAPDQPQPAPPAAPSEAELQALREELSGVRGAAFWDKLETLCESGPFRAFLDRWFPSQHERLLRREGRRDFLRTMGASLATLGLGACTRQPDEKILPFSQQNEYLIPGKPRYFATAFPLGGDALGVLVESHMNRPTKIEGNPDHPASRGATDALAQASILELYDPDRSHSVMRAAQIDTWDAFLTELTERVERLRATGGAGLAVLVEQTSSPTLRAQLDALRANLPEARVHHWSPLHRDEERTAALATFGRDVAPRYAFDRARVVVSLDADFLGAGPASVRHARDFAAARRGRAGATEMNRLYVVEGSVGLTGAMADHRLAVKPSRVEAVARLLAAELGLDARPPAATDEERTLVAAMAADLRANQGAALVVPGTCQPTAVHELAHRLNALLGNVGATVEYVQPVAGWAEGSIESITALTRDIRAGRVSTLVMIGGNPVYDAPSDLDFRQALGDVAWRAHLSSHVDETSNLCHWHVPLSHYLESWSDARAVDGTVSIVQPLIAPLYASKTAHELVAVLNGVAAPKAHDLVRAHWQAETGLDGAPFEAFWERALHDGVVPDTRLAALDVTPVRALALGEYVGGLGLEVALRPDACTFDGRFANNGWLQETPGPITRLTWDNAALVSRATADEYDVSDGDVVVVATGERRVEAPILVTAGHPDGTLTLHLGYGRTAAGGLGDGVGADAYKLRTSYASWRLDEATLDRTGATHLLAGVQDHPSMEGRDLVRVATFDRFRADPERATLPAHGVHDVDDLSIYPLYDYSEGNAWGMVIDLNACIGCNACMVACQSENNVPIVGREEVAKGREMHWIRIDRYFEEDQPTHGAAVLHQPVPCMHCEQAPCEVVCPVGATVHSDEGLNDMVYNRCVGTRYCANNCPYKVRRFNFALYADWETEALKMARNPDVSVRSRGVMEKCTYCVQRINHARIEAKKDERPIRDGEARSACMQVCPTEAIVFGNINDPDSRVSELRREPHHYGMLAELGIRPRTTYLAKLTNPNPELRGS